MSDTTDATNANETTSATHPTMAPKASEDGRNVTLPTGPGQQNEPIEDGANEASRADRIAGILVQVHEDVRMGHAHDEAALLRQRLEDAGIAVSDEELERYLDR